MPASRVTHGDVNRPRFENLGLSRSFLEKFKDDPSLLQEYLKQYKRSLFATLHSDLQSVVDISGMSNQLDEFIKMGHEELYDWFEEYLTPVPGVFGNPEALNNFMIQSDQVAVGLRKDVEKLEGLLKTEREGRLIEQKEAAKEIAKLSEKVEIEHEDVLTLMNSAHPESMANDGMRHIIALIRAAIFGYRCKRFAVDHLFDKAYYTATVFTPFHARFPELREARVSLIYVRKDGFAFERKLIRRYKKEQNVTNRQQIHTEFCASLEHHLLYAKQYDFETPASEFDADASPWFALGYVAGTMDERIGKREYPLSNRLQTPIDVIHTLERFLDEGRSRVDLYRGTTLITVNYGPEPVPLDTKTAVPRPPKEVKAAQVTFGYRVIQIPVYSSPRILVRGLIDIEEPSE